MPTQPMSTQNQPVKNSSVQTPPPVTRPTPQAATVPPTQPASKPVLRPLNTGAVNKAPDVKGKPMKKTSLIFAAVVVILFGTASGYGLAVARNGNGAGTTAGLKNEPGLQREVESSEIKVGTKVGIADESTFKDNGEGTLEKGGLDGEGSHHLVRPGGDSQTIYVTSSVIDLDQFVGRKVKVWGETFAGRKAGWFMDVGKLEVLE